MSQLPGQGATGSQQVVCVNPVTFSSRVGGLQPHFVRATPRPSVSASLGPLWGCHVDDVNLALGDLAVDVGIQEAAYR